MSKKAPALLLAGLVLLVTCVNPLAAYAQTADIVAILVIDVFEPSQELTSDTRLQEPSRQENCLVAPTGQSHTFISGASAFTVVGQSHTFISGASGSEVIPPHGRLVYSQLEDLIDELGGSLRMTTSGDDEFGVEWLRDIMFWDVAGGTIILAGVDTDGYTTKAIVDRIPDAMDLLARRGVDRFVLNMSFAIIPCDDLARTEEENIELYEQILLEEFPQLANRLRERGQAPREGLNLAEFAQVRMAFQSRISAQAFSRFYGTNLEDYQSSLLEHDPLRELLEELSGDMVISIASAGNLGDDFPFAPGYWPEVVSVSADYSPTSRRCPGPPAMSLTSNAGEVMMDGVLDLGRGRCAFGTSFAAPRLSLDAALYLLAGGRTFCSGATSSSSPPLAHLPWDDLSRSDAASRYCDDFNRLVP